MKLACPLKIGCALAAMEFVFAIAGWLLLAVGMARADDQITQRRPSTVETELAALRKQRAAIADQIALENAAIPSDRTSSSGDENKRPPDGGLLPLLKSVEAVVVQHEKRLERVRQIEGQLKEADKELASLDKFKPDEPRPYSFLLVEKLNDQLKAEEDRESAVKADLKSAEKMLQAAHEELDATAMQPAMGRQTERPLVNPSGDESSKIAPTAPAKSSLAKTDSSTSAAVLTRQDLVGRLARAKIGLEQTEVELQSLRLDLCKTLQKQLAAKIKVIKKDAAFSIKDRDRILGRLAGTEADLKRQRATVETRLAGLETDQAAAFKELNDKGAPQAAIDAAAEAWRVAAETYQTELVVLDQRIENAVSMRQIWKHRYELAGGTSDPKKLKQWLADLDEYIGQLKDQSRSLEQRNDTARAQQNALTHTAPQGADSAAAQWRSLEETRLVELRDLCETSLDDIQTTNLALGRFRDELKGRIQETTVHSVATTVGGAVKSLFNYKVTEADNETITIGSLLTLTVYLAGGVALAYSFSRLLGRRMFTRWGMHQGTAAALNSIIFYSLCIVFGVLAFQLLHIPMAAFAFLGGAAAIAIGFGSQDIMNNFMSGIILLVEHPIRVGDVVRLSDVQGVVSHIGLRSTCLRTELNHELIVPNKTLLDEQVTNLTLSDNFVQTFVAVSVDRKVPLQEAKREMLKAAFFHPLVLKSPQPVVLLREVDSYWMTFEVHFSMEHYSFMKCSIVQSQILEEIADIVKPM